MSSAVDIANIALARLGDDATVSSFDPPEGSTQADHCARFYPIARDTILSWPEHAWTFATRRAKLAPVAMPWSTWRYAYAVPSNMLRALAVLAEDAPDDYATSYPMPYSPQDYPGGALANMGYQPQDYTIEAGAEGQPVLYTNQEKATLRYVARVSDPTRYPPLFVDALAFLLASHLAGPVIKGDSGASMASGMYQAFIGAVGRAVIADARQGQTKPRQNVPWISNR